MIVADRAYQNKDNNYITKVTIFDVDGKELKANKDYDKNFEYFYEKDAFGTNKEGDRVIAKSRVQVNSVIKVVVKGKGNYATTDSTIEGFYTITKNDFSKAKIKIVDQIYTGDEITLDDASAFKEVKVGQEKITEAYGEKYEIVPGSYRNNIKKGTASVMIRGTGKTGEEYGGVKTVKFKITSKKFSKFLPWDWLTGLFS